MKLSRFFPYFIIAFGMSTGGSTSVGEVSYYLDQQDELNEINRKIARIRRSIFDYWFYDSSMSQNSDIASILKAVRGESSANNEKVVGVKIPEGKKLADLVMHLPDRIRALNLSLRRNRSLRRLTEFRTPRTRYEACNSKRTPTRLRFRPIKMRQNSRLAPSRTYLKTL
jgi:hypothetical protein